MRRPHLIRDLALYILIGLAVMGSAVLYGLHSARTNGPPKLPTDWLALAAFTALVFVNTIRQFWGARSARFWVTWGLILALHLGFSIPLVHSIHPVPIVWIALVAGAEQVVIWEVIARVLGGPSDT